MWNLTELGPTFDPGEVVGNGWRFHPEYPQSKLKVDIYHAPPVLVNVLTEVEILSQIPVSPKVRRERLLERGYFPVGGAEVFELMRQGHLLPQELKERTSTGRPLCALALGTVLFSPGEFAYVLYLYWWETRFEQGGWRWHYIPFEFGSEFIPYTTLAVKHE